MPRKYPPLTPDEVVRILRVRGFDYDRSRGSHEYYKGIIRGVPRMVTVDLHYRELDARMIRFLISQSGLTHEEFYGSTKQTAKKINLRAKEYPIPLKE